MKKAILSIVMVIIVCTQAHSQFTIGPKAGLNISTMHSNNEFVDDFLDYKTGFNIGIFGKYSFNKLFDIQMELLYSQQGYKGNIDIYDHEGNTYLNPDLKVLTHNLNIPLLLKYNLLGRRWLFIEAGPQVGLFLGEDLKLKNEISDERMNGIGKDFKTADISIVGGIGFYLGNHISVNARYNHGLTSTHDLNLKNRVFQIALAYDLWQF